MTNSPLANSATTNLSSPCWIAFAGNKRIAVGAPREVASAVKQHVDAAHKDSSNVLIFDAHSSATVEIDLRGALSSVLKRLQVTAPAPSELVNDTAVSGATVNDAAAARTAGRPKLGVVAREVTLLPRHWEWLATQPGGASVALRKLVEEARRSSKDADRLRQTREAAYRFMNVMAGDQPGFEEASRALFAGELDRLRTAIGKWPRDIREHALQLAAATAVKTAEPV